MMGQDKADPSDKPAALDMLAAVAAPQMDRAGTPGEFLATLSEALKALDDVDVDLARILADHLLTEAANANAVANANAEIVALATQRAAPVEEQADG